jgi:hypothetical protein
MTTLTSEPQHAVHRYEIQRKHEPVTLPHWRAVLVAVVGLAFLGTAVWIVAMGIDHPHGGLLAVALAVAAFTAGMGAALIFAVWPRQALAVRPEATPAHARLGQTILVRLGPEAADVCGRDGFELGLVARRWRDTGEGLTGRTVYQEWEPPLVHADGSCEAAFQIPADGPASQDGGRISFSWSVRARGRHGGLRRGALRDVLIWVEP